MSHFRILLLGDYSNLHSLLGRTLTAMGHEVTVISDGSGFQDTQRDITIRRRPGKIGGLQLCLELLHGPLRKNLCGYDIVALQNPNFLPLKPKRLRYFFDRLRNENGTVFLSCAGTDPLFIRECLDPESPLQYNEYRIGDRPAPYAIECAERIARFTSPEMNRYCDYVYKNIDGAVTALYEYDVAVRRFLGDSMTAYGGLPLDISDFETTTYNFDAAPIKIFLGRHRNRYSEKGTDLLEKAARRIVDKSYGKVSLQIVENVPYRLYTDMMCSSHLMLDQIYSYTPAMNALIGMGHGLNVISGGENDFYKFIGEDDYRPIINAPTDVDALADLIDDICSHPELMAERGQRSREFVLRHHDPLTVASRYLNFWKSKLR